MSFAGYSYYFQSDDFIALKNTLFVANIIFYKQYDYMISNIVKYVVKKL